MTVDVGNTNTVFAVFREDAKKPIATARASTRRDRMPDEWYAILAPVLGSSGIDPAGISAMVVSSVVPSVTRWLTEMGQDRLHVAPIIVGIDLDLGIGIDYPAPQEIGPDRLVNAMAAVEKFGAPVISIDFGTAINFDVVNAAGNYVGGALAPGLIVALDAMVGRAARLFSVELTLPEQAIGRSTTEAIQSGMMLGYLSMLEGMIQRIKTELGGNPPVVITGGYSEIFAGASPLIDHFEPDLTSQGLALVYWRNKPA
ncbi:MAG: type III pantothenate kinase [Thermomicrobiales bacterium]